MIDPAEFACAFQRWTASVIPALGGQVTAIDGKASRHSRPVETRPGSHTAPSLRNTRKRSRSPQNPALLCLRPTGVPAPARAFAGFWQLCGSRIAADGQGQNHNHIAFTSAVCPPMPSNWPKPSASIGRWKTTFIGVWMLALPMTKCACGRNMLPIIWQSSSNLLLTSSGSIPPNAKAPLRPDD